MSKSVCNLYPFLLLFLKKQISCGVKQINGEYLFASTKNGWKNLKIGFRFKRFGG